MFKIPITHIVLYFIFHNKYIYSDEINKITLQTKIILLSTQKNYHFFIDMWRQRQYYDSIAKPPHHQIRGLNRVLTMTYSHMGKPHYHRR